MFACLCVFRLLLFIIISSTLEMETHIYRSSHTNSHTFKQNWVFSGNHQFLCGRRFDFKILKSRCSYFQHPRSSYLLASLLQLQSPLEKFCLYAVVCSSRRFILVLMTHNFVGDCTLLSVIIVMKDAFLFYLIMIPPRESSFWFPNGSL